MRQFDSHVPVVGLEAMNDRSADRCKSSVILSRRASASVVDCGDGMREKTDCTGGMAISVHFVGKNALPAAASGRPRGRSIARAQQLRIFAPLATLIFAATALAQDTSKAPAARPPEVQSSQPSAARVVDLKARDGTI